MIPAHLLPVLKIVAVALTALISSTGFLAWLAGTDRLDWRGWLAVVVTAVMPIVVGYLVPSPALPPGGNVVEHEFPKAPGV